MNDLSHKAFQLYKKSLCMSDYDHARLYLLNAITHSPDIEYIECFMELIEIVPVSNLAEFADQTSNMLSMVALQGDPDNIDIISLIQERIFNYVENKVIPIDEPTAEIVQYEELSKIYDWDVLKERSVINDIDILRAKSVALQDYINNNTFNKEEQNKAELELQVTISYIEYILKCNQIQDLINFCLQQNKNMTEEDLKKYEFDMIFFSESEFIIESYIQQARLLLSQVALLNIETIIDGNSFSATIKSYSNTITCIEHAYLNAKSSPVYQRINNIIEKYKEECYDVDIDERRAYTKKINFLQKMIAEVSKLLPELKSPDYYLNTNLKISEISQRIHEYEKCRYANYQQKCATICKDAISSYHEITTYVSEKEALGIIDKTQLAMIDESLICPECSELYHTAKSMLQDKLDKSDSRLEFHMKCITGPKFKLEDF